IAAGAAYRQTGGTVGDNATDGSGGGILSAGSLTLSGGDVSRNTAAVNGGGVANLGAFTLSGGSVDNNSAVSGGGVWNATTATYTHTGGTFTGNSPDNEATER
ncbi:MAG TPA: hypothetical protein VHN99_02250, partial [Deinococcales bacterium]|nr:hypothetical protein [Deinococcales bacterium]